MKKMKKKREIIYVKKLWKQCHILWRNDCDITEENMKESMICDEGILIWKWPEGENDGKVINYYGRGNYI